MNVIVSKYENMYHVSDLINMINNVSLTRSKPHTTTHPMTLFCPFFQEENSRQ